MHATASDIFASRPPVYDPDYWAQRFPSEPYLDEADRFEDFEPAFRFGHSLQGLFDDFDSWEDECRSLWDRAKEDCRLTWERAKHAIRAGWQHAERQAQSKFDAILQGAEEKLSGAFHRLEENIRTHPAEFVTGAAAAGYVASRLPVRRIVLTSVGIATAILPGALLVFGLWKTAAHLVSARRGKRATPRAPDETSGEPFAPERIILTDEG